MKLYRLSVIGVDCWHDKKGVFYAMANTKKDAEEYLKKNLANGYKIIKIIELGEQISMILYGKGID